jgi:hypothetical protein
MEQDPRIREDEALARLLDKDAARGDVVRALQRAAKARRFTVVRVVTEWLAIAERTVNEALREFRGEHLPEGGSRA